MDKKTAAVGAWATGAEYEHCKNTLEEMQELCPTAFNLWWIRSISCIQKYNMNLGMELAWTEVADLNTAKDGIYSAGASNTTALATCGRTSNPTVTNICETESWNGSSWTEVNDANQAIAVRGQRWCRCSLYSCITFCRCWYPFT